MQLWIHKKFQIVAYLLLDLKCHNLQRNGVLGKWPDMIEHVNLEQSLPLSVWYLPSLRHVFFDLFSFCLVRPHISDLLFRRVILPCWLVRSFTASQTAHPLVHPCSIFSQNSLVSHFVNKYLAGKVLYSSIKRTRQYGLIFSDIFARSLYFANSSNDTTVPHLYPRNLSLKC